MSISHPMIGLIDRLFREAPKMLKPNGEPDETQAPAVQCQVFLRYQVQPHFGAMSRTKEGLLRIMTPAKVPDGSGGEHMALIETFFDQDDVVSITVERAIEAAPSSRSSLIIS